MLPIQKKLTQVNRTVSTNRRKEWIVIHFVGAVSTAKNNVDYFYDNSPKNQQLEVLERFLDLALEHQLPAIIHIRDKEVCDEAYTDAYRLLEPFARKGGRPGKAQCLCGKAQSAIY